MRGTHLFRETEKEGVKDRVGERMRKVSSKDRAKVRAHLFSTFYNPHITVSHLLSFEPDENYCYIRTCVPDSLNMELLSFTGFFFTFLDKNFSFIYIYVFTLSLQLHC